MRLYVGREKGGQHRYTYVQISYIYIYGYTYIYIYIHRERENMGIRYTYKQDTCASICIYKSIHTLVHIYTHMKVVQHHLFQVLGLPQPFFGTSATQLDKKLTFLQSLHAATQHLKLEGLPSVPSCRMPESSQSTRPFENMQWVPAFLKNFVLPRGFRGASAFSQLFLVQLRQVLDISYELPGSCRRLLRSFRAHHFRSLHLLLVFINTNYQHGFPDSPGTYIYRAYV